MKNRLGLSALFVALYTNSYIDKTTPPPFSGESELVSVVLVL